MLKNPITIGEKYSPAMEIKMQAEADNYFEELVSHSMHNFGMSRTEAESLERANLGYYAGYYDSETRARVESLFLCAHPFLGSIAEKGSPSPEEAFAAGQAVANHNRVAA